METLFEEEATSPTASSVSSPAMFPAALAQDGSRDRESMRQKMPVRAHTSPGGRTSKLEAKRRPPKARTCLKCNHTIDDGRWIQMETQCVGKNLHIQHWFTTPMGHAVKES